MFLRCRNTQHNDTQHNDTLHNITLKIDTQHDISVSVFIFRVILLTLMTVDCHNSQQNAPQNKGL